jgi:hypothetical protein
MRKKSGDHVEVAHAANGVIFKATRHREGSFSKKQETRLATLRTWFL